MNFRSTTVLLLLISFLISCSDKESNSTDSTKDQKLIPPKEIDLEQNDNPVQEKEHQGKKDSNSYVSHNVASEMNSEKIEKKSSVENVGLINKNTSTVSKEERVVEKELKSNETLIAEVEGKVETIIETEIGKKSSLSYHHLWDGLLKKYVDFTGKVNYQELKTDEIKVKSYLSFLKENQPKTDWSNNEKLAYLINLYNASTIQLILSKYPVKSITDLNGGKPWDLKFIDFRNKKISLNDLENEIIRKEFSEPRIHFAVNCAAKSCPKLRSEAFTADKLEKQLDDQAKHFLLRSGKNSISNSSLELSKIFEWYAVDFGQIQIFINKYTIVKTTAKVSYIEYDWSLND